MHKTKWKLKNIPTNNAQNRKRKILPPIFNILPPSLPANDVPPPPSFITDDSSKLLLLLQRGHGVQPASDPRPVVLLPVLQRAYTSLPPLLLPLFILLILFGLREEEDGSGGGSGF